MPAPRRHHALEDDISTTGGRLRITTSKRKSRSEENDDGYIDAPSSRKILAIARTLADEDAAERSAQSSANAANPASGVFSILGGEPDVDGGAPRYEGEEEAEEDEWMPDEDVEAEDIDAQDLAVYKMFLPERNEIPSLASLSTTEERNPATEDFQAEDQSTTNLADLILQRIAEKEGEDAFVLEREPPNPEVPEKVADVFHKCGRILSRYKSGPLPKPFKILPTLPSWPDLLMLTRPEAWTANAIYAATKIFISASSAAAQHFLTSVLLDRVKDDIHETKRLNVHLYNSLKKSLYKPAAFFKGFLFPLVLEGCSLREAHIVSSVLARVSIPVLHSAAALLRLCEIAAEQSNNENAGAANIFIRVLLEKKYALPYKAIDALVFHFLRFRALKRAQNGAEGSLEGKEGKLPVLWHQSLLVFAQRYKNDITEDQREALLDLLLIKGHKEIGPEVRRELLAGRRVGGETEGTVMGMDVEDGDDTMNVSANV